MSAISNADAAAHSSTAQVKVWDPLVRLFHWSLVGLFTFAFLTGDEWDRPHELAGYGVAALIALRVIWGFVGTRHARFSDFLYHPQTVIGFLKDSLLLRAKRYVGHNPAGGAMVVALLLMLALVTATGIMMTSNTFWGEEWVEELHEFAANGTLALIVLHVVGVIVASLEHGENLARAMITGRKRAG